MPQAEPTVQRARHLTLGERGERIAVQFLEHHGCTVLSRNWRRREGELDIVAVRGNCVLFCEVKTRSGLGFGTPAESINQRKIARIRRLAAKWLSEYRVPFARERRFDVIEVLIRPGAEPLVHHIPGAF